MNANVQRIAEALHTYAASLYEPADILEVVGNDGVRIACERAANLPALAEQLGARNESRQDINVRLHPLTAEQSEKTEQAGPVACGRFVMADVDPFHLPHAAERIGKTMPAPTLLIASGHGRHYYWRLDRAQEDCDEWELMQREMATNFPSDAWMSYFDRCLRVRLPGFLNWKNPAQPVRSSIVEASPGRRYSFSELRRAVRFPTPPLRYEPLLSPFVFCVHWRDVGRFNGGRCAIGEAAGRPRIGYCDRQCKRRQMPTTQQLRHMVNGWRMAPLTDASGLAASGDAL